MFVFNTLFKHHFNNSSQNGIGVHCQVIWLILNPFRELGNVASKQNKAAIIERAFPLCNEKRVSNVVCNASTCNLNPNHISGT